MQKVLRLQQIHLSEDEGLNILRVTTSLAVQGGHSAPSHEWAPL